MSKCENKYEYGIVATACHIILEYEVEKHKDGQAVHVQVRKEADLDIDPKYMGNGDNRLGLFSQIVEFQKAGNAILRRAKKLLEAGQYIKIALLTSQREHVEEYTDYSIPGHPMRSSLRHIMSNCWEYCGNGTEGELDPEEGGLYFRPDTRYTDEYRDLFLPWGKDILKLLAEDADI